MVVDIKYGALTNLRNCGVTSLRVLACQKSVRAPLSHTNDSAYPMKLRSMLALGAADQIIRASNCLNFSIGGSSVYTCDGDCAREWTNYPRTVTKQMA